MKVLVTGATGLLGSHLLYRLTLERFNGLTVEQFSEPAADSIRGLADEQFKGLTVIGLRRESSDMEAVRQVFSYYGEGWEDRYNSIEWRIGNVLDQESLEKALDDIDIVFHCAAIVSFDPKEREKLIKANIEGTRNVVNTILSKIKDHSSKGTMHRARQISLLHVSSTSALGDSPGNDPTFLINETTPRNPNRTHSGYSVSKYESEKIVWEAIDQGLDAMIVNPGIILGPGFWDKGSSKLFTQMKKGLKFYTKGGTGYVDVRDVVAVMVEMSKGRRVERSTDVDQSSTEYLIPNTQYRYCLVGHNLYYKDFFNMVAKELGVPPPSIKAGKFLSGLAWRMDTLKARLTGGFPLITKETAESANRISFYASEKVRSDFHFEFRTIEDTIRWVCKSMKQLTLSLTPSP